MAGKAIDDLNLSDQPLQPSEPEDPRGTAWYRFMQEIDDLIATGTVGFAETTLRDMQLTIERTKRVTDGQQRAVRNIEAAGERSRYRPRAGSRRYEGFR